MKDSNEEKKYEVVDVECHITEALGFLKDWVTSIIQIETGLLGGIGAAVILKADVAFTKFQVVWFLATAVFLGASIVSGVNLLNMLPGAVQRVPTDPKYKKDDVYSIATTGKMRIVDWTRLFRITFYVGLAFIVVFAFSRAWPADWWFR